MWWASVGVVLTVIVGCSSPGETQDGRLPDCTAACGTVLATGPTGPTGPPGQAGPAGAPGGAYRWHDAAGTQVTVGPELLVWVSGVLWRVGVETGEAQPFVRTSEVVESGAWIEGACDGEVWIVGLPPRFAYGGIESYSSLDGVYGVRPDTLGLSPTCGVGTPAVPFSDLDPIEKPDLGFVPPLHPEPIE